MSDEAVLSWLNEVERHAVYRKLTRRSDFKSGERSAKRVKRERGDDDDDDDDNDPNTTFASPSQLPTPAGSDAHNDSMMASQGKRQRVDGGSFTGEDDSHVVDVAEAIDDATPRGNQNRRWVHRGEREPEPRGRQSPSVTSRSSSRVSSSLSHRSTPTKQYRNAELQETGFRQASFTVNHGQQPPLLRDLHRELKKINHGEKLIPNTLRGQLLDADLPEWTFFDPSGDGQDQDALQWRYPSADLVTDTLERAALCLNEYEGESSWNHDVHGPLLHWVFRSQRRSPLVDFRYCTSAQVISHFKPKNAPSKMVDYCIIIRPEDNSPEQDAIDVLCRRRPGLTINHTDWGNLCKNPIVISVETKRQGENWDNAILQMGTWHASQWRSLRWGREHALASIGFLPGIIIQGHDWLFVATTFENNRAKLYHSVRIGETETELGIYKLVLSLQKLQRWIETVYWPTFQADVLK